MDRLGCGWEESSINIEGKATPFWYRNHIAAVRYVLGHPQFHDRLSFALVKPMDSNDECIHAEMWWKMQASFHVLSERWCQRECVRECVRELMSESVRVRLSDCQRECVREHVRECQSQIVRDCVSEFHCVRAGCMSSVFVCLFVLIILHSAASGHGIYATVFPSTSAAAQMQSQRLQDSVKSRGPEINSNTVKSDAPLCLKRLHSPPNAPNFSITTLAPIGY
jgi:hypothetical protein